MPSIFNKSGHIRFWSFISNRCDISIDIALESAKKYKIISNDEYEEYKLGNYCKTGCKYANYNCNNCPFEMKDPRLCLGGLFDCYQRAHIKFKPIYKSFCKNPNLKNDIKFMKKYKRMKLRLKRLANRIVNHKIRDDIQYE